MPVMVCQRQSIPASSSIECPVKRKPLKKKTRKGERREKARNKTKTNKQEEEEEERERAREREKERERERKRERKQKKGTQRKVFIFFGKLSMKLFLGVNSVCANLVRNDSMLIATFGVSEKERKSE